MTRGAQAPQGRAGLLARVPARVHVPLATVERPRASRRASARVRGAATAVAAALGVMLGLGVGGAGSNGWATALARLAVVALRLRGVPEFVTPDRDAGAGALGGGIHVAFTAGVWGVLVGAVVARVDARQMRPLAAAAFVAATGLGLAVLDRLLPPPLRLAAGTLDGAEWALMIGAVVLAAWIGARSARP